MSTTEGSQAMFGVQGRTIAAVTLRATMGRAIQEGHPVLGVTADGRYVLGAAGR